MCPTGTAVLAGETSRKPDLRSAFDVLDVDRDGKISPDDLRTFYGHYNLQTVSSSSSSSSSEEEGDEKDVVISSMISVADQNKDGFVEYEEFEKVLLGSRDTAPNRRRDTSGMDYLMENVFRVMDKDGD